MRTSPLIGVVLLVTTGALLAGCAQPGQLGHESSSAAGAAASTAGTEAPDAEGPTSEAPAPTDTPGIPAPPVTQAGSDAQGRLERPVDIRTPGPAELLVRTEVLQPGESTGWIRHPGTAISAVRSGTVTVVRAGRCEARPFGSDEAFYLADGEANELRNDGPDPVVLTRSELLAPGAPEREPVDPAC